MEKRSVPLSLADYIRGVDEGWPESDIYRIVVSGLPRGFCWRSSEVQRAALAERVPLTHTKWDALLAAVVEHVAWLHGLDRPAWVDESERFLDPPWVVSTLLPIQKNTVMYAPPAFRRHGALPDPRDLDRRGGEWFEWVPGNWSPFMTIQHPTPQPPAVRVMQAFLERCETLRKSPQATEDLVAAGRMASVPGLPEGVWWSWDADKMAAAVAYLNESGDSPAHASR